MARFSVMPVCLKSSILAKPLYIRSHNYAFRCDITLCKLCNFFVFLSFKITELWPFLWYFLALNARFGFQLRQISDFLWVTRCWSDMPAHWERCLISLACHRAHSSTAWTVEASWHLPVSLHAVGSLFYLRTLWQDI